MRRKDVFSLAVAGLLLYMLGNWALPITDPVESNYAETAKEMMEAGDYVSPRIFGNYWYDKPILFYLELIGSFHLFGMTDFAARFFPAVFAVAGILMTYGFAARLYDRRTGLLSAVLLGVSVEYWYLGHAIVTDMTLFVTVSASLMSFYAGYESGRGRYYYLAFAAAALAVLDKGPIGLALPGLVILIFLLWQRRLSMLCSIHMLGGLALFLVVTGLWYVPMYLLHGSDFLDTFLGVHNVLRATVSEHPRNNIWYYYLLVFLAGFFPWSLVVVPSCLRRLFKREVHLPSGERERFLLVWSVSVFVAFECMASKYMTYTFPYMMPLAVLMGRFFLGHETMFWRMAKGMGAAYLIALLTILPLATRNSSGQDIAKVLEQQSLPDTVILTYGIRYPVSIAYYSSLCPQRLVATQDDIEKARPHKMSWTATNVMPFASIEKMDRRADTLLVTDREHVKELGLKVPGYWKEVGSSSNYVVYRLDAEVPYDGHEEMTGRKSEASHGILETYLSGNRKNPQIP